MSTGGNAIVGPVAGMLWLAMAVDCCGAEPAFTPVQPELFAAPGGQSNAWGDFDNDGDLDIYIGYAGLDEPANRLFRNNLENGQFNFTEVGEAAGVALRGQTRHVSQ